MDQLAPRASKFRVVFRASMIGYDEANTGVGCGRGLEFETESLHAISDKAFPTFNCNRARAYVVNFQLVHEWLNWRLTRSGRIDLVPHILRVHLLTIRITAHDVTHAPMHFSPHRRYLPRYICTVSFRRLKRRPRTISLCRHHGNETGEHASLSRIKSQYLPDNLF